MSQPDRYRETLRDFVGALKDELTALEAGDVAALESALSSKLNVISALKAGDPARDAETDALIQEGASLCEQAALRVNLLLANVTRRLDALAALSGHGQQLHYGRDGRMRANYHALDLKRA